MTQFISNLDWNESRDFTREWVKFLKPYLQKHFDECAIKLGYQKANITNIWFQQYSKGDYHGWHNHGECQFANVYFLDLPDTKMTTQFYKEEPIEVEEGTILTFPSWLIHSSPINTSNKTKTVIAFNSSFYVG